MCQREEKRREEKNKTSQQINDICISNTKAPRNLRTTTKRLGNIIYQKKQTHNNIKDYGQRKYTARHGTEQQSTARST